ncbi:MAG: anti-sigma factor [Betaproteobacteria bacterium]|nr:anti-sigma factor [Betaproteobacteria bacterium]
MKVPDENDLHALVDGKLSPQDRAQVEAALAGNPALRADVEAWRSQRDALRELGMNAAEGAVPVRFLDIVQPRRAPWLPWLGGALAGAMMGVAGWLGHAWYAGTGDAADARVRFVHDARVAHAVYSPEVRHPVEVGADQSAHLVQWLSKRLGAQLKAPVLQSRGYELVGGRLLPGDDGARAQFMYQDSGGERITLYVTVLPKGSSPGATAFRFEEGSPVAAFYWIDGDFGYALSGNLPRNILLELSKLVYSQLTG